MRAIAGLENQVDSLIVYKALITNDAGVAQDVAFNFFVGRGRVGVDSNVASATQNGFGNASLASSIKWGGSTVWSVGLAVDKATGAAATHTPRSATMGSRSRSTRPRVQQPLTPSPPRHRLPASPPPPAATASTTMPTLATSGWVFLRRGSPRPSPTRSLATPITTTTAMTSASTDTVAAPWWATLIRSISSAPRPTNPADSR